MKGLFNLAQLIEMGHRIPASVWKNLRLGHLDEATSHQQINEIYEL